MKKIGRIICIIATLVGIIAVSVFSLVPRKEKVENENKPGQNKVYVVSAAEDTGASTASAAYKGGAIFLEPNANLTMRGGTISGHTNIYGGAIYISNGATFTMEGGTIKDNSAEYGGAIYVESGGHCIISSGLITLNKAVASPAIYAEEGADLQISSEAEIKDNISTLKAGQISRETIEVGAKGNGVQLHYLYFGSYPQTYVGDEMNEVLENWYVGKSSIKEYDNTTSDTSETKTWTGYKYTDGNIYVRGLSKRYINKNNPNLSKEYTYLDGTKIKDDDSVVWFKVEPIRWVLLNYDQWLKGEGARVTSELVLTSNISFGTTSYWNNSYVRKWLNDKFLNSAFTSEERSLIKTTHLKNNTISSYNPDPQNPEHSQYFPADMETDDKAYFFTYHEIFTGGEGNPLEKKAYSLYCSPTDFALSNASQLSEGGMSVLETNYRKGVTSFRYRSSGPSGGYVGACEILMTPCSSYLAYLSENQIGIRPVIELNIKP